MRLHVAIALRYNGGKRAHGNAVRGNYTGLVGFTCQRYNEPGTLDDPG
jgi:hypothetical protein